MKREIKFRAWVNNKMCYPHEIQIHSAICEAFTYKIGYVDAFPEKNTILNWQKEIIFTQFTGLHDKNGKEIYEGDKIKYKNTKGYSTVDFENGAFGYYGISSFVTLHETNLDYIEIIGNIYEL